MSYHQDDGKRPVYHKPGGAGFCGVNLITMPVWVAWFLLSPRRRAYVRSLRASRQGIDVMRRMRADGSWQERAPRRHGAVTTRKRHTQDLDE